MIINIYINFIEKSIKKDCFKLCPLECESLNNDLMLSSSNFPTENFYNILDKDFAEQFNPKIQSITCTGRWAPY